MIQLHLVSIMISMEIRVFAMLELVQASKYSFENCFPELKVTIVDSLNKRIQFLNHLAADRSPRCSFVHDRAESYGKGDYRESYDIVTARAVARLTVLSELCLPIVKKVVNSSHLNLQKVKKNCKKRSLLLIF